MSNSPECSISGEFDKILELSDNTVALLLPDVWWQKLIEASMPYQDARDDSGHAAAVVLFAAALVAHTDLDNRILFTAALLHDTGWSLVSQQKRARLFAGGLGAAEELELRLEHERKGAELAARLLENAGAPEGLIPSVCSLIDGHDTRIEPLSFEDRILHDADSLWMVTAAGFAADLRRRRLSASEWAGVLRRRFSLPGGYHNGQPGGMYTSIAKKTAFQRLDVLDPPNSIPERGKVLIAHYRVGWTDGVSLEIEKRKVILEEMGFKVYLLSGPGSRGADYIIDELDFETEKVKNITRKAFGNSKEIDEHQLILDIYRLSEQIEAKLSDVIDELEPDFILTHNIFSHGRHIAAARAFCKVLKNYGAASLTTHHDFYWERDDFKVPSCPAVEKYLAKYVPPEIPQMKHAVINSLAAAELERHSGISAMIFPDTLDFSVKPWIKDDYNKSFLNDYNLRDDDILILQATRIVRRKGIELIAPIVRELNKAENMSRLVGRRLYNGKQISPKSRFVFLLAGYAEHEAETYRDQLQVQMDELNIEYRFLQPGIAAERSEAADGSRIYSLFDTYPYADLVSYPSLYEGWGNQFIEAVFAHKPIILYEYPVYKSDIKHIGYNVISLGSNAAQSPETGLYNLPDNVIKDVCESVITTLLSDETSEILETNFRLANENNSYKYLRQLMKESMKHYEDYGDI